MSGKIILVPAVISLAVTLLRLVGELNRWSPTLFNRDAGGPGALIGIVWLVPIFGVYFALQLSKKGHGPASAAQALGFAAGSIVAYLVLVSVLTNIAAFSAPMLVVINVAAAACAILAYRGWPELGRINFLYGLAARIPVVIIMFIAIASNWGTHYELGPPGLPRLSLVPWWLLIGVLPQLFFWVSFTVMVGALFGSLAVLVSQRSPRPVHADSRR